jgi:hypothetical protein
MADTPTQNAERNFDDANRFLFPVYAGNKSGDIANLAMAMSHLATGLKQLSIGLRATYQKLEEMDKRQSIPR